MIVFSHFSTRIKSRKNSKTKSRNGAVLLAVVVLLTFVVLLLTRLSISSMTQARNVVRSEQLMRKRWVMTSLRQYVLASPEILVQSRSNDANERSEAKRLVPVPFRSMELELGGQYWNVMVFDESSKFPLFHLASARPISHIKDAVDAVSGQATGLRLTSEVLATGPNDLRSLPKRFENWFDIPIHTDPSYSYLEVARKVTLWGAGQVNLRTADPIVINATWRCLFGRSAPSIVLEYAENPDTKNWEDIVAGLNLREADRNLASQFFGTTSTARSVWITPVPLDGEEHFFGVVSGDRSRAQNYLGLFY